MGKTYAAIGELRAEGLVLLGDETELTLLVGPPGAVGGYDGLGQMAKAPHARLPRRTQFAFRERLLEFFAGEVDGLQQDEAWEEWIQHWITSLSSGKWKVCEYNREPMFTRVICRESRSVVGPSPLTERCANSEHELTLELRGDEHARARAWFEQKLDAADDITDDVIEILRNSWAGPYIDPMDLYYKVLTEYFSLTIEGLDVEADDNPLLEQLTEFQVEAYQYAKGVLRRFGGVFLADVVGLGKTFIALALLRHLQDRYGQHAVVLAPPAVCVAWNQLAAEFRIELQTLSTGKLEDLVQYADREVLVIDESHNFRNVGTQRYERVMQWLRPEGGASDKKVVLISATPQNNHPNDVKHQLQFFPDNYTRLPYAGESLDAWFTDVRRGEANMTDLLQHVVVRRTRRFIENAYPDARIRIRTGPGQYTEVPLEFPTRVSGGDQCLRYSIDEEYGGGAYTRILTALQSLNYALYGLGQYVLPAHEKDPQVYGIMRAGTSVRGLYKVLVLKRLESSMHAFDCTLRSLIGKIDAALERLDAGQVRVRQREDNGGLAEEGYEPRPAREVDVSSGMFDAATLRAHLQSDRSIVLGLLEDMQAVVRRTDVKVDRLEEYLRARPPTEHPTIVFTQFADTANYLGDKLQQRFGPTSVVTGSSGNAMKMAARFAPKANRAEVADEDRIYLLISTDALSEGVNLQDADTLINFDIHWNPVRLIQRAGRIDRLGSENDEIHVASFLPETGLEQELGLEAVLRARITDFLNVFGEDSGVLPSDDTLDDELMASAYTGAALEAADEGDEMDGLSRHVERLFALRRDDQARYEQVLNLRRGRRAISTSGLPAVAATRLGWFWHFWSHNDDGAVNVIDDPRGLDLLYQHGEAGAVPDGLDLTDMASPQFAELVHEAITAFEPVAEAFREQRQQPRLSPTEEFIVGRLERYHRQCVASRQDLVSRMMDWVRAGHAKTQINRVGRTWKREKLPPETVYLELVPLFRRFPPQEEELGDVETVGAVLSRDGVLSGGD